MRKGGELRGNCYDRRRRKEWMLSPEAGFGGDGESVPCAWCAKSLAYEEVESDRVVPGHQGGRYVRGNVVPACRRCNEDREHYPLDPANYARHPLSGIPLTSYAEPATI